MVIAISYDLGWENLSVRVGFSADMADRNAKLTKDAAKVRNKNTFRTGISETSQDYYLDTNQNIFSAKVLYCGKMSEKISNQFPFPMRSLASLVILLFLIGLFSPRGRRAIRRPRKVKPKRE